jgi:hypothetical protein
MNSLHCNLCGLTGFRIFYSVAGVIDTGQAKSRPAFSSECAIKPMEERPWTALRIAGTLLTLVGYSTVCDGPVAIGRVIRRHAASE